MLVASTDNWKYSLRSVNREGGSASRYATVAAPVGVIQVRVAYLYIQRIRLRMRLVTLVGGGKVVRGNGAYLH